MRSVQLGATGLTVSEFGFGGIPIIRLDTASAQKLVRYAVDKGITLFDTANKYVDSEDKMGQALQGIRQQVVIATKTGQRDGKAALAELERSLRLLRTDYIDLYQLHQISQPEELDAATAPGGVLEVVRKAQEQGKVRHIGVSSHNLAMALTLVDSGLFASMQFPLNFIESEAVTTLHPRLKAAGMGNLVMKPFAGGMIDDAKVAFSFLRQYPEAIPLPGFDTQAQVDEILDIYSRPNAVTPELEQRMEGFRQELGGRFCRRCEYCQPCPQGVSITYAMMYRVVSIRMSPDNAVSFSGPIMETVRKCIECGECETRCPYNLPIAQMLHEHLEMYDRQRKALADCTSRM